MIRALAITWMLIGLVGCAAPRQLMIGPPAWSRAGLINWKHGENSLTVEFQLSADTAGHVMLDVRKSERLMTLVRVDGIWNASGPMVGQGWTGRPENAPIRLAGWISLVETLEYIQQAPAGVDAIVSGRVRARWTAEDAEIITMESAEQFRVIWQR